MANQLISLPPKLLRSQPSTHRVHPSTEQPAASNQASTQGKHADHPETCFLFTILRRLKHRKRQRALRACRTDCRNRANNTDAAPKNDELAALGGRKPKEIKYLYNRRGRRRSTAQLSVAGVEALPRRRISCESVVTAAARRARRPPAHHPTTPTPATTRATPASAGPGATTLVLLAMCSRSPGLPLARSAAGSAALGCSAR